MAYLEYEPRETLFQFTSFEGFKGIVESKQLWFSDLKSLNDPRELIYGLGRVRPLLEEIVEENPSWDRGVFRKLLDFSYDYLKNTNLFTCSFCPTGDLMPLWQHYGADGSGLAIGFRPRAIAGIPCRVQKVEYVNDQSPTEDLKKSLNEILEPISRLKVEPSLEQRVAVTSSVASSCTSTKHSTWEHEREIRAVYAQSLSRNFSDFLENATGVYPDGTAHKWREPEVRQGATGEVKFLPFSYGKYVKGRYEHSGAIQTVYVGPRSKTSVPEVTAILRSEGFKNFEVLNSECVWR